MKKVVRWLFAGLLCLLLVIAAWQHELIGYGLDQLRGQMKIILKARPLEKVLADPAFPDSLKAKLILIQEIKIFATDSLGIKESKNYTTVYDQKGEPALWVLTAAEPYDLKEKMWSFPFLGEVSYKGFFKKEKGEKEELELKKLGYDTDLGITSAWSTLGFFRDPVLTGMLRRSEGSLANLIIHELTHGTLYVKDDVDFNENLASFIGDQGAIRFLKYKYGNDSPEYRKYMENMADDTTFDAYMVRSAMRLDSLYKTFMPAYTTAKKDSLKIAFINEIFEKVNELDLNDRTYYYDYAKEAALKSKNAFFMGYMRYSAKKQNFEEELDMKFNGNLKNYLRHLKQKYPSL